MCVYALILGMIMRCEREPDSGYLGRDLARGQPGGNKVIPRKEETKRT